MEENRRQNWPPPDLRPYYPSSYTERGFTTAPCSECGKKRTMRNRRPGLPLVCADCEERI